MPTGGPNGLLASGKKVGVITLVRGAPQGELEMETKMAPFRLLGKDCPIARSSRHRSGQEQGIFHVNQSVNLFGLFYAEDLEEIQYDELLPEPILCKGQQCLARLLCLCLNTTQENLFLLIYSYRRFLLGKHSFSISSQTFPVSFLTLSSKFFFSM